MFSVKIKTLHQMEKAEFSLVFGAYIKFLRQEKIDFIFTEVNFIPTYEGQPLLEDIISYMRTYNYYPYNFYGINESKERQSIITNILFISNKVAKQINTINGKNSVYNYK